MGGCFKGYCYESRVSVRAFFQRTCIMHQICYSSSGSRSGKCKPRDRWSSEVLALDRACVEKTFVLFLPVFAVLENEPKIRPKTSANRYNNHIIINTRRKLSLFIMLYILRVLETINFFWKHWSTCFITQINLSLIVLHLYINSNYPEV